MRKWMTAFLGIAVTMVLTACPRHSVKHHHHGPPAHAKAKGHVKHVHKHGCGHVLKKGIWVKID